MFKNYVKTAFRSLGKNKGFTAINIFGLALGLAAFLLIMFYVIDELGYDKFNLKADRIYRINDDIKFGGNEASYAVSPAPMAAAMQAEFPEVEKIVRFRQAGSFRVKKGDQEIQEQKTTYADPSVFSIFTLPMLAGNAATALAETHTIVLTASTAKKYFNTTDAIGKTLVINDTANYKVTGVIKDIPKQSHFQFDFFISMVSLAESRDPSWLNNNFQTYVLLKPGASIKTMQAKFPQFMKSHLNAQLQSVLHMNYDQVSANGDYFNLSVIPLKDIHLHSNTIAEMGQNGSIEYVYIFTAIAIFIMLIACVNFMNLSTARSANRAREVGVRKVLGSARQHLIFQFIAESLMVTFIAAVIALIIAWALLPLFNQMSGKELIINAASLIWLVPSVIFLVIFIGLLAGSYPAFFLSGFQPIEVLKGMLASGFKGGALRSFLVVFQFAISIFLIIGTLVIYNQLKYIQHKDLGYSRENVLVIKNAESLGNQAITFKQELKQLPGVIDASLTSYTPTGNNRNSEGLFQSSTLDSKTALHTQLWTVDEDYLHTMGMKLAAGRNFSKDMLTDSSAVIINEAAAKQMGVKDPLNKIFYHPWNADNSIRQYRIIGVIKDFNFNSLRENISPLTLILGKSDGSISVRLKSANMPQLIAQIENKWKSIDPNQQFDYSFMDQDFDATYRTEQRTGKIFISFTSLAIIIACLGLFGLAAYAAEQRNKEIGIRKVLGAGLSSIVGMLTKDFIKLVLIAIVIAAPLAWFAMQQWLQGFAYRQAIQWWIIAAAGMGAILIAFITISFQSVKAAMINPVKSLRSE